MRASKPCKNLLSLQEDVFGIVASQNVCISKRRCTLFDHPILYKPLKTLVVRCCTGVGVWTLKPVQPDHAHSLRFSLSLSLSLFLSLCLSLFFCFSLSLLSLVEGHLSAAEAGPKGSHELLHEGKHHQPTTNCLTPTVRLLPTTTQNSPPGTYHPPLTTQQPPPTTHHMTPATHHPPPTT